jgi:hypothetical protein
MDRRYGSTFFAASLPWFRTVSADLTVTPHFRHAEQAARLQQATLKPQQVADELCRPIAPVHFRAEAG